MSRERLTTKTKESSEYKYSEGKELFNEWWLDTILDLEPFFKSYGLNRRTFVLQCCNLFFVAILLGYFIPKFLNVITPLFVGGNLITQGIWTVGAWFLASGIFRSKTLRWQKLFEMGHQLTKKMLKILIVLNMFAYFLTPESLLYGKPKTK